MRERKRVLVCDDSALMRKLLRDMIESDPVFEVVDTARDGEEAVLKARELRPDVVTMDINMPRMDGLTALQIIVEEKICPVVVVSSLTQEGALVTLQALELGAFDCVAKPGGTISRNIGLVRDELLKKLRAATKANLRRLVARVESRPVSRKVVTLPSVEIRDFFAVAIGISTGGPKTIYEVLPYLPGDLNAAVFLVQHMPPEFTRQYAERLDRYCELKVVEAEDGMVIQPGFVYVGRGGYHLKLKRRGRDLVIFLSSFPPHMFVPSVDIMMESVLEHFGPRTVGVLMTGMGSDGAEAMRRICEAGGYTIAESEETAVVFGMPQEAIRRGGAKRVLPSYDIPREIVRVVGRRQK